MAKRIKSIPLYWYTLFIVFVFLILSVFGVSVMMKSNDSFNTHTKHTVVNQSYVINDNKRLYGHGSDSLFTLLDLKDGATHRSSKPVKINAQRADNTHTNITVIPSKMTIYQTHDNFATVNIKVSQDIVTTTHYLHKWNIFNRDSNVSTHIQNVHKVYSIHAPAELMAHFTIK